MEKELSLTNENILELHSFPYRWVPLINLFDPEIPGFPLYRIHFLLEGRRVFGAPITFSVKDRNKDESCTLEFHILSNINLESHDNKNEKRIFIQQLEERFGVSEALTVETLEDCCQKNENWKIMVNLLFPRLSKYYGEKLPCGQFYSELFGILRFISAWNTPGGRKQEIIMMNNVLHTIGEPVNIENGWQGLNLRLIPTYEEVLRGKFPSFQNFNKLKDSIIEYGEAYLTKQYLSKNLKLYLLEEALYVPKDRKNWEKQLIMLSKGTQKLLTQLKEDYNRMYQRTFFFITFFYNIFKGVDFSRCELGDYIKITTEEPRGFSPKVLGCFLQQSFQKYFCIPIDIWVESFFGEVLQTPKKKIITSGKNLGKFERMIWGTVQLRKTNQPYFNDILYCIKTGVLHSNNVVNRKANPLSCRLCTFKNPCPVSRSIAEKNVLIVNKYNTIAERKGLLNPISLKKPPLKIKGNLEKFFDCKIHTIKGIDYIIIINSNGHPDEVYFPKTNNKKNWALIDNMSGFTIDIQCKEGIYKVNNFSKAINQKTIESYFIK